jgi:hypothetical protein
MSNAAAVKTRDWGRKISAIALAVILCGCIGSNANDLPTWNRYSNPRYDFEFLYPSNWQALPAPDNEDGRAFISLENSAVEIRGWAGNQLPHWENKDKTAKKSINTNFKTAQGVPGVLMVEVGQEISAMKLTLTQGQVRYYWQGKAPSQEFDEYYRVFYYIAQQYRIRQ